MTALVIRDYLAERIRDAEDYVAFLEDRLADLNDGLLPIGEVLDGPPYYGAMDDAREDTSTELDVARRHLEQLLDQAARERPGAGD